MKTGDGKRMLEKDHKRLKCYTAILRCTALHNGKWHGMAWQVEAGDLFNSVERQLFLLPPAALCRFPPAPVTDGHKGNALHALKDRCPPLQLHVIIIL